MTCVTIAVKRWEQGETMEKRHRFRAPVFAAVAVSGALDLVWWPATTSHTTLTQQTAGRVVWRFDAMAVGGPPAGFSFGRTGSGRPGRWVVRAVSDAPSGSNVLAQEDRDHTDYRFPVAVADTPMFNDVSVSAIMSRCTTTAER
jgi:hypothetical protein